MDRKGKEHAKAHVRDKREKDYFSIDNAILDGYPKVGQFGLLVYFSLARHANYDTEQCFVSLERIAADCRISKPSACRGVKELEDAGLLKVEREHRKVSVYTLMQVEKLVSNRNQEGSLVSIGNQLVNNRNQSVSVVASNNTIEQDSTNKTPSASKKPEAVDPQKELKTRIRNFIQRVQKAKTKLPAAPWNGREGKALDQVVKDNPSWTDADWKRMLENWSHSSPELVRFGDRAGKWLDNISRFSSGPILKLSNNGNSPHKSSAYTQDADEAIAELERQKHGNYR